MTMSGTGFYVATNKKQKPRVTRRLIRRKITRVSNNKYKNMKKTVKKIVRSIAETKFYIEYISTISVSTSGIVYGPLANIVKGDDQYERIGEEIYVTSMMIQFILVGSTVPNYTTFRLVVYRPKGDDITTVGNVFFSHPTATAYGPVNIDKVDIYHDEQIMLNNYDRNSTPILRKIKVNKRFQYTQGAAVPSRPLRWLVLSDATVNTPQIAGYMKVNYKDI